MRRLHRRYDQSQAHRARAANEICDRSVVGLQVKQGNSANIDIDLGSSELNQLVDMMVNRFPQKRVNAIQLQAYSANTFHESDFPRVNENNLVVSLRYKRQKNAEKE